MKTRLWLLVLLVSLCACSRNEEMPRGAAPKQAIKAPNQSALAYEHRVQVDADEDRVASIYEAAQLACRQAESELCTVLDSSINTGPHAWAALKFRAKPGGIQLLLAALSQQAKVIEKSTTAEDLAGPIEDGAKKLTMLKDYRAKLEALRSRPNADLDGLIRINKELAQVQSDIESVAGAQARLQLRVQTETLLVQISTLEVKSLWRPIGSALGEFGQHLAQATSTVITAVAYFVPWAALLATLGWLLRLAWRRWRRA